MDAAIKRLKRILSDLDEIADHFEGSGFYELSDTMDDAASKVEEAREQLKSLSRFDPVKRGRERRHA